MAQSVEHRTGIAEVMGSNPVGASEYFLGFLCNCLSYFATVKITFTSILGHVEVTHAQRMRPQHKLLRKVTG